MDAPGNTARMIWRERRARLQEPLNGAGHLPDRAVGLDGEQRGHVDGAGAAHPAQVVAHHVDDHEVLGPLLLGLGELVGQGDVGRVGRGPGPGAFHGPALETLALATQEQLRGEAEHLGVAEVEVGGVGDGLAHDQGEEVVERVEGPARAGAATRPRGAVRAA